MANRHAENSPCFNSEGEEDLKCRFINKKKVDFNLAEVNENFF